MSNHPSRLLPFYITAVLFFWVSVSFCAEAELTEMQKQAQTYRIQGYGLQEEGKLEAALPYYEKALYVDPANPIYYNDVGIVEETLGNIDKAKEMYLKAMKVAPDYPNSYSNLALLYEGQKDYSKAVVCWIRRSILGKPGDYWREMANRRLGEIEADNPEAYNRITEQYKANIQQAAKGQPAIGKYGYFAAEGPKVTLFTSDKAAAQEYDAPKLDNKDRAESYLKSAKEYFNRREYATALKEATVAGYLDPSNNEINDFVEKVRKKLLE